MNNLRQAVKRGENEHCDVFSLAQPPNCILATGQAIVGSVMASNQNTEVPDRQGLKVVEVNACQA